MTISNHVDQHHSALVKEERHNEAIWRKWCLCVYAYIQAVNNMCYIYLYTWLYSPCSFYNWLIHDWLFFLWCLMHSWQTYFNTDCSTTMTLRLDPSCSHLPSLGLSSNLLCPTLSFLSLHAMSPYSMAPLNEKKVLYLIFLISLSATMTRARQVKVLYRGI